MSRFAHKLIGGGLPIALEITPPRDRRLNVLLRRAALLDDAADAVNVIQRPDRMSSLDASLELLGAGYHPVWHLLNRGRSRGEVEQAIARAADGGIRSILCIRGEHDEIDKSDTPRIRDVVAWTCEAIPDALVGVTLNPYAPRDRAVRNLIQKLDAGAGFVQTNPVFDLAVLEPLAEEVKSRAPGTRIVPMAIPILTREGADRLHRRVGVPPPRDLGWDAFSDLLQDLRESRLVDGIALMTLEMDVAPAQRQRLLAALSASGVMP